MRRLFEGFRPDHYELELVPDRDAMTLQGSVTITGRKTGRPSQRLTLHQHGLKVTSAVVTKADKKGTHAVSISRINHHDSLDEVRLHADELLYPGNYRVTLEFNGKVQQGMHGIYASSYELDGQKRLLVSTQFESHHAREAFPCVDEPEAKATFDLTLVSPAGEAAIGNTPAKSQTTKDGKLYTTFETTPKMSTYLLAFVYGDMHYKGAQTKNGIDVKVWATKAQPAEALEFGLDVAVKAIEFYEQYYDTPYPLAKCDHVAIPDFSAGAMENWGLITYRERCLLVDPATTSQSGRELVSTVVCHELSHQWFGNLVTMKWWDDIWLNESFADVMEYVATDALFPEWHIWNDFVTQEGLFALRRDAIAGVQAVHTPVHHPDEISTVFDPSIVYAKGGRLIHMLMRYLGEADFRKGLKAYFKAYAYGNTIGDDLWKALSDASGKDVAAFMTPWLAQSGFPVLSIAQEQQSVTVTQKQFLLDPSKIDPDRLWPVPLLSNSTAMPALLDKRSVTVQLPNDAYIRLNEGSDGHYIVHYTNPKHAAAVAELAASRKLATTERLMLLSDSALLSRAAQGSFSDTLALLAHYTREDSEPVWDIMGLIISDCRRFVDSDDRIDAALKKLVRGLIQTQFERLGWEEHPAEPSQDTKLRATIIGLGVYAEHEAITKHVLELFEAYKKDQTVVTSELRGIVFSAAIRHNVSGALEYFLELDSQTNNVDLKQDILGGLCAERRTKEIGLLLDRLKDSDKVRQQDVDHWLAGLMRNRFAQKQAWQWLKENWQWLEETFGEDKSYDYLPRYAASSFNTKALLDDYRQFFEPMKTQPALARNITIGVEELENRVAWIERDIPTVQRYFHLSA